MNYCLMIGKVSAVLLLLLPAVSFSQRLDINLSPKHQEKLSSIESGHKRLVKFQKYYKKDSARHIRKMERHYRRTLDSAYKEELKREKIQRKFARKGTTVPPELTCQQKNDQEIRYWQTVLKDSTSSDSLKEIGKIRTKELTIQKVKNYPGFQHLSEKYQLDRKAPDWEQLNQQLPGMDSLESFFDSPDQLFTEAEDLSREKILESKALDKKIPQVSEVTKLQDQYNQYGDLEQLKKDQKENAVRAAADYFADHPDKIVAAQAKVSKLLSKYRDYSSSSDLGDAKKQTSLDGKTLWERLVIGGNFQVVSTKPFSMDLSPQLGYRFTSRFFGGVGLNCRYTAGDSITGSRYVSPASTGGKLFASYDLVKSFFVYSEYERTAIRQRSNDEIKKQGSNNYFIGAGRKFLVHPKVYMTLTALYNLNGGEHNAAYPRRLQVRVGFQMSELATRKKRIYYDPNR